MSLRVLKPGEPQAAPEERDAIMREISRTVGAGQAQWALKHDNRERSLWDRISRGLSPWGAQTSRYAPEPEDVESI